MITTALERKLTSRLHGAELKIKELEEAAPTEAVSVEDKRHLISKLSARNGELVTRLNELKDTQLRATDRIAAALTHKNEVILDHKHHIADLERRLGRAESIEHHWNAAHSISYGINALATWAYTVVRMPTVTDQRFALLELD